MTGPFSQKPWQPVLLTSMLPERPRASSSLCSDARTLSAPDALHPLPAQTEMQGRAVSKASRHSRISLRSWCDLSFCMACLVRDHGLVLILVGILFQQASDFRLREVGMSIGVVDPSDRREPTAADAAHSFHR